MRYLGIDYGEKRIGLSIGDDEVKIAFPLQTLDGQLALSKLLDQLVEILINESIGMIILGLPIRLNGQNGIQTQKVEAFKLEIEKKLVEAYRKYAQSLEPNLQVKLWDERLSTSEAQKRFQKSGVQQQKQRSKIDQAAATIILQAYLDSLAYQQNSSLDQE